MQEEAIKVLTVEDNALNALHLEGMLTAGKGECFSVVHTETLSDGIEKLKTEEMDLVLLDLNLPDSSGLDTLVYIQGANLGVPIVVLSGMDDEEIAIQAVKRGAQDYLIKGQFDRSLLIRSIHHALERHRLLAALEEAKKAAQEMAHTDFLTGLPNRQLFYDRLERALTHAKRSRTKVGLLYFDLNKFKSVNDTLGHSVGDGLLQAVAERLKENLRESDTIARLGGDEFTAILEGIHQTEDALYVAHKILELFSCPFEVEGHQLHLGTSIGISLYPDDSESADLLVNQADIAMYHAKKNENCEGIRRYHAVMKALHSPA